MNIIQIFNYLFPKWEIVKVLQGYWVQNGETEDIAIYTISYSKRLNKYKLKISGFWPKKHRMYPVAIKYLNYYKNGGKPEYNTTTTTNP